MDDCYICRNVKHIFTNKIIPHANEYLSYTDLVIGLNFFKRNYNFSFDILHWNTIRTQIPSFPHVVIFNTCPSYSTSWEGCHWMCLLFDGTNVFIFDSECKDLELYIEELKTRFPKYEIVNASKVIQQQYGLACGVYCLVYILGFLETGTSILDKKITEKDLEIIKSIIHKEKYKL